MLRSRPHFAVLWVKRLRRKNVGVLVLHLRVRRDHRAGAAFGAQGHMEAEKSDGSWDYCNLGH
jgi:hypothetical protein